MNNTKKLTEASLLSSLFVITTIISVSTGFGYALYLDFIVPVFFCLVYIKCEAKYTLLSGVTSLVIVGLVLGNIGTAIWATQSVILGIVCGYFISKSTTIIDDIVYCSIAGVIIMVVIDIYFSTLIGYSFIEEFSGYAKSIPYKEYVDIVYYSFIALFPMGTVFSIYVLSLFIGKKVNILKGNAKKKMFILSNFRSCGRFLCCSKNVFYSAVIYIVFIDLLKVIELNITWEYLNTIMISIQYLCIYFVIRDSYSAIQNYVLSKYGRIMYVRGLAILVIISLILMFKVTMIILIVLNSILNKSINIRIKQIDIVNSYVDSLFRK